MITYKNKCISLLSGGLDSATATALALESGYEVIGLSFDYGQRHKKELEAAKFLSRHFGLSEHKILNIDFSDWGGSSLLDKEMKVPNTNLNDKSIPTTYVPGRNTIFIAFGLSLAEIKKAQTIVLGINAMDYSGYPDCRPDYLDAYQFLAKLSSKSGLENNAPNLWAPLINWEKTKIIQEALRLKIPISKTWSCYLGQNTPCGKCDSCRIRNTALLSIDRPDLCS